MIHAVLHGKAGDLEKVEDGLTSVIFGRLRYLDPAVGIVPFLETAMLYDSAKTTLASYFKVRNQTLGKYRNVTYLFWPRHSISGEPDLVLIFSCHDEGAQDLLLLIECKFKSPKSGVGADDQLKRYYIAINNHLDKFTLKEIQNFRGEIGPIIYLTEMEAFSEIEESIVELEKQNGRLRHPIFHLRWQNLHKTLYDTGYGYDRLRRLIFDDLSSYLNALNLVHYTGVTPPSAEILRTATCKETFFLDINEGNGMCDSYFSNLPQINLPHPFFGGAA